jgi:NAD(P)-dependent dehydrogenase (short-subunit alcohol dehydrogenase family)
LKKEAKTFGYAVAGSWERRPLAANSATAPKSFLVLFFKKEHSCLILSPLPNSFDNNPGTTMQSALHDNLLAGKVAFVAGGTSGINLEIARRYARAGASVAVLSRKQEKVDAAVELIGAEGGRVAGFAADVRNYEAVETALRQTAETLGKLDIVLSGAAGNFPAPVLGMSANAFKAVVDIDLLGTFHVLRACYAYLNLPGASLLSITAGQAVHPMMFQAHVCAAKAGVNMLTKCLAMEWGPAGVRVNAISPGPIANTEGMRRLAATPDIEARIKNSLALRDFGTTTDIAEAALFLASDSARYITGAILNVDGGTDLGNASTEGFSLG